MELRVSYRRLVHRFADAAVLVRIDPPGAGEVWCNGKCLWRLKPELMAIYEDALVRGELRQGCDGSFKIVDAAD